MKKEEIIRLYKDNIKKFTYNNFLYFEKSTPEISDAEFDALKKEILQLEKDYTFLKHKDSPSKNVGFKKPSLSSCFLHLTIKFSISS